MKMRKSFIFAAMLLGLSLTACNQNAPKITGYSIDENNNIVVIYDNGNQETVGNLTDEDIVNHVTSITISQDGFFVINGIKTTTKVNFSSVTISSDGYYVIDGIKTSIKVGFDSITISSDGFYVVNGIKTNIKATNVYTVSFDTGYSEKVNSQKVFEGYKVERPELLRTGYNLDGWYCNGEEWRFNSDVVMNDMTLKAKWTAKQYTITFVNEKGEDPANLTVTYDQQYTLPQVDAVDGYSFEGWYNGSTKYSGGTWKTDSNVTLTAKWTANEYTITLDPGVGEVSKTSQTVTYNSSYKLPVPTNDYGVFVGWLCDGILVTDNEGNSLEPWTFTENKTFTVDWEIKLYTANDLEKLYTYPNASFSLMNDIDLSSIPEWLPVGDGVYSFFTGHFEGNGHTISNVNVNTASISSRNSFGFFGTIDGATIQNVNIKNFTFSSTNINQSYTVGALFGRSSIISGKSCTISNCKVEGSFTIGPQSSSKPVYAGGIAGLVTSSTIDSCINEINITNAYYAGGIVAYDSKCKYSNCLNLGNISASTVAGGIVGYENNSIQIKNCINNGMINGPESAGGICGWAGYGFTGSYCVNTGKITSTAKSTNQGTGGIVGAAYDANQGVFPYIKLTYCYNTGSISGINCGGLFGYTFNATVKDSYNNSSVSGSDYSGGIGGAAGGNTKNMTQCLASGSVSGGVRTTMCGPSVSSCNDCYYTYSSTSSFFLVSGTYTSSSNALGSVLYKDSMYWVEYNPESKIGQWLFHDSSYPTLAFESTIEALVNSWN